MKKLHIILLPLIVFLSVGSLAGQALSPRTDNYRIRLTLDTERHQVQARQSIVFHNPSTDTIWTMPFHIYYHAFKNNQSTFFQDGNRPFGLASEKDVLACRWAWVDILSIEDETGYSLLDSLFYLTPPASSEADQTVLEVRLRNPILPLSSYRLELEWYSQIPHMSIRTGYGQDYYFMAQWYPKLGVYEPAGTRFAEVGQWNCHPYYSNTEYYGEFGQYEVQITLPSDHVVGATGVLTKQTEGEAGTTTHTFTANDVIDFTWTACPRFLSVKDYWREVDLELLIVPEHQHQQDRFLKSAKHTLDYLAAYLDYAYPYPKLTVVSPPYYGLFSGAMEYSTLVTSPTLYALPLGIKTTETLVIHEVIHQYFQQMVATNEQEEPWMDEGFTAFFESKIMDQYYPRGVVDIWGVQIGAGELRRGRFLSASNIKVNPLSDFGWWFRHGSYSELVYGKAAVLLSTLEGLVGEDTMRDIMRTYFDRWKFRHPCREDFIVIAEEVAGQAGGETLQSQVADLLQQGIYGTDACDYSVHQVSNQLLPPPQGFFESTTDCYQELERDEPLYYSRAILFRNEGFRVPQEILVTFDDGTSVLEFWDGQARSHELSYTSNRQIVSVQLDPNNKIPLDKNLINNSYTSEPDVSGLWYYLANATTWLQGLMTNTTVFL